VAALATLDDGRPLRPRARHAARRADELA
jgi:hypothetical protein